MSLLACLCPVWWLEGWDSFAGEHYRIPGRYWTFDSALRNAHRRLKDLEKYQPSSISGGQEGLQDRIYIRGPNGCSIDAAAHLAHEDQWTA